MNHAPYFNDDDAREWRAQERALQDERDGSAASDDPLLGAYRDIARALRTPLPDALPADFARTLAARCEPGVATTLVDTRLEQQVQRLLLATLAVAALVATALYGAQWWQAMTDSLPMFDSGTARNWSGALLACLALSWAMGAIRDRTVAR